MTRTIETYTNYAVAFTVIIGILTLTAGTVGPLMTVTGDSMDPTIDTPAIAYCSSVDNPAELEEDMIIGYETGDSDALHRVAANPGLDEDTITTERDNPEYTTKNNIPHDNVICEYQWHIELPFF